MNQYVALARKLRPPNFDEFVGQTHVVKTLINSLDNNRIHHAYIFSGTRGIGKTTLARILAKCLNCTQSISSKPCGTCHSCQEINRGASIDLIEVDAASRTKVEDTRELLDNIQLSPSSGRYRIYLIDEVHMLSKHSFNALLKTLEEPPEHVKFLFATTEVQKLPVTILSRCIHFKLKSIPTDLITNYLEKILTTEKIVFETTALNEISKAALGSMRDALTLTEQFISFGNGQILMSDVRQLLGIIDNSHIVSLLEMIMAKNTHQAIEKTHELSALNTDFGKILDELLVLIHKITLVQTAPKLQLDHTSDNEKIQNLSKHVSPEDLQLLYQIGLIGRRDLLFAPSPEIGLEMTIVRMICFIPKSISLYKMADESNIKIEKKHITSPAKPTKTIKKEPMPAKVQVQAKVRAQAQAQAQAQIQTKISDPSPPSEQIDWPKLVEKLGLNSASYVIATNSIINKNTDTHIELLLSPDKSNILTKNIEKRISDALSQYLEKPMALSVKIAPSNKIKSPLNIQTKKNAEQTELAKQKLLKDPNVQSIMETFNAEIIDAQTVDN